jgi:hypothetical protein
MTLIKELIEIPEKVQRGDFVLNLSTGLAKEAVSQTLNQYVVTEQLKKSFDDALTFIKSTVDSNQNKQKGVYLHGSFGSGKSHFMAVLHLLLQGNAQARAMDELASAVHKHDEWMQKSNILLVPYHMIGAASIEAGVLGGYAKYIKKLHPEAPVPGFYMSDALFKDAQNMRETIGDDAFFTALNKDATTGDDDGWGDLSSGWDAVSFDVVVNNQSSAEDKSRLVSDLVGSLFKSMAEMANTESGGYVDFDEGLRIMTQHAKALGYDSIILFLDELILWLASHLSDQKFIANNIQKIVKLVEPSEPRALPIASFIARQRDLREFVGDQYTGSEQEVLSDSLKYWDGRFHTITLEDRNLPVIAEKRLLKPVSEAAKNQIDDAFNAMDSKMRDEVNNILLTNSGDRGMFRSLYPFSPALIQALVALSSALQRERTALKVMLMLLVDQRESLELGGCIPVGDLYDVIGSEAEPFSDVMRNHFENAKTLFERKLIPLLEAEHNVTKEMLVELPEDDERKKRYLNDSRLIKTLLLSALVPEVECFKQLTGNKLAALNHGTIKSPIPGREAQTVLHKCQRWAGQVGEIKISEDSNPVITIQLSGVDTESILEQAQIHDNDGARRKLVKDMLFDAFGIQDDGQLFIEHSVLWKGSRRNVEVLFQNIREIKDSTIFEARGDDWKIIIDYPFDKDGHSPADDKAKIQEYEDTGDSARTLCWLPYFLSKIAQQDLGTLVKLEYVLKNDERFSSFSKHLSPTDRAQARTLLDNQRSQLRQRIKDYLMGAYGASETVPGSLDNSAALDTQIYSLEPSFTPSLPVGSNLGRAFDNLLDQSLNYQYPEHPDFKSEVKLNDLGKVFVELRKAIHATNGRVEIESAIRPLMRSIAQPIKLGEMHERHFIFKPDWPQLLTRTLAQSKQSGEPITVARLRAAMDEPNPKGLTGYVQNLLIWVFAEHGHYAFSFHGGEYDPNMKDFPDNLVLIKQELSEASVWKKALDNAGAVFGVSVNSLLTANHQNELIKQTLSCVNEYLSACEGLKNELSLIFNKYSQKLDCNRHNNAAYAVELLIELQIKEGVELVKALAEIKTVNNFQALAKSITSAERVTQSIQDNNWGLLESVWSGAEGKPIKESVYNALAADELVTSLAPSLRQAQVDATRIVTHRMPTPEPDPVKPQQGVTIVKQERKSGISSKEAKILLSDIEAKLDDDCSLDISYTISKTSKGE